MTVAAGTSIPGQGWTLEILEVSQVGGSSCVEVEVCTVHGVHGVAGAG